MTYSKHCQKIKFIYLYIQLLNTMQASKLSCRRVQHENNLISKHSNRNQVCFCPGRTKTFTGPIVSWIQSLKMNAVTLLHYVVNSETYVLMYCGGGALWPGIIHFMWLIWTRSFQITRYRDRCLYTTRTCIKTIITGNCGCLLLHILISNIIIL